jgi:hypothetical protein
VDISWSRHDGQDCVRVTGVARGADLVVRPAAAVAIASAPAMAGRSLRDGGDVCFVPRFGFVAGTTYTVTVAGVAADLIRPRPDIAATTEVVAIHPTATVVPRNLLRCYVEFSAPMSDGDAGAHVRLVDGSGEPLLDALLPTEYELWDTDRRRLTVLLDPARIKRGLVGHIASGYPLRPGEPVRFVVDAAFRDARGVPLRVGAEQTYQVGDDLRGRVEPTEWTLTVPAAGSPAPLVVEFGRPLDHGLLQRCLRVLDPDGRRVDGTPLAGAQDRSWQLTPTRPWPRGEHILVVDPVLEDVAGNSVTRVFDRDLGNAADTPGDGGPVRIPFRV